MALNEPSLGAWTSVVVGRMFGVPNNASLQHASRVALPLSTLTHNVLTQHQGCRKVVSERGKPHLKHLYTTTNRPSRTVDPQLVATAPLLRRPSTGRVVRLEHRSLNSPTTSPRAQHHDPLSPRRRLDNDFLWIHEHRTTVRVFVEYVPFERLGRLSVLEVHRAFKPEMVGFAVPHS